MEEKCLATYDELQGPVQMVACIWGSNYQGDLLKKLHLSNFDFVDSSMPSCYQLWVLELIHVQVDLFGFEIARRYKAKWQCNIYVISG